MKGKTSSCKIKTRILTFNFRASKPVLVTELKIRELFVENPKYLLFYQYNLYITSNNIYLLYLPI